MNIEGDTTQIIFSSKTGAQNSYAYILFPKGAILTMSPQSAITIQNTNITVIQGNIQVYIPTEQSGYLTLSGDLTKIILDET